VAAALTNRRRDVRRTAGDLGIADATIRPGRHVRIVEASAGGASLDTERQLRPGSRVHLLIVLGSGAVGVAGHVLRCAVAAIHVDRGVTYRGAIRFDERCARLSGEHPRRAQRGIPDADRPCDE
jgi:hypothetical protein